MQLQKISIQLIKQPNKSFSYITTNVQSNYANKKKYFNSQLRFQNDIDEWQGKFSLVWSVSDYKGGTVNFPPCI